MKVWEFLDKPEKWTKGNYAKDTMGKGCYFNSVNAVSFCISGAIAKCYGSGIIHILSESGITIEEDEEEAIDRIKEVNTKLENFLANKYNWHTYDPIGAMVPLWNDLKDLTYTDMIGVLKEVDV